MHAVVVQAEGGGECLALALKNPSKVSTPRERVVRCRRAGDGNTHTIIPSLALAQSGICRFVCLSACLCRFDWQPISWGILRTDLLISSALGLLPLWFRRCYLIKPKTSLACSACHNIYIYIFEVLPRNLCYAGQLHFHLDKSITEPLALHMIEILSCITLDYRIPKQLLTESYVTVRAKTILYQFWKGRAQFFLRFFAGSTRFQTDSSNLSCKKSNARKLLETIINSRQGLSHKKIINNIS